MKPQSTYNPSFRRSAGRSPLSETTAIFLAFVMFGPVPSVLAADGNWNADASGNWSTDSNWNPSAVPGLVAGDTINLTWDITAARTVTIDTTGRIAGDLNIGDSGTAFFPYTLAASGGAKLTLAGAGESPASIDFLNPPASSVTNVISTPLVLTSDAVFRSNGTASQTISGLISDGTLTRGVTFNNDVDGIDTPAGAMQGQFVLTATSNTYDGGTHIEDVRVSTATAGAFGTGEITVAGAGQVYFTGGTRSNSLVLASSGWSDSSGNLGALRLENATVSGLVTLEADTIIGVASNTTGTISGQISGSSNIRKVGGTSTPGQGALALTADNSGWSGHLTVDRGTVRVTHANALGTGGLVHLNANSNPEGTAGTLGATLELSGSISTGGGKTLLMTTGSLDGNARATLSSLPNSFNTWEGAILLESATAGGAPAQIQSGTSGNITILGPILATGTTYPTALNLRGTGTGRLAVSSWIITPNTDLAKVDSGTWTIDSTGGDWRNTVIAQGTLTLGNTDALDPTARLVWGQASATGGTLNLSGFDQTVAGMATDPASPNATNIIRNTGEPDSVLTVHQTSDGSFRGGLSGSLSLVKDGPGTLTFNRVPTLNVPAWTSGTITVNEGTFILTGNTALGDTTTSTVIADGAAIGGKGWLGGNLTLGSSSGATLLVDGASTWDDLTVGGALTLNGTTEVRLTGVPIGSQIRVIDVPAAPWGDGLASLTAPGLRNPVFSLSSTPTPGIDLTFETYQLSWKGQVAGGGVWDSANAASWQDISGSSFTFYPGDDVVFEDVPGRSQTVSVAGNVLPNGIVFINSSGLDYLITGAAGSSITANNMAKVGNGEVVLDLDQINIGTASIDTGVLQIGNGGTTGSFSGSISNSGELRFDHGPGARVTVPARISGIGTVSKTGGGTTVLTGASTYMGGTTVEGGVLEIATAGASGGGGITVANGTLRVNVAHGTAASQIITLGNANSGSNSTVLELPVNTTAVMDTVTLSSPLVVSSAAPDSKAILRYPGGTSGGTMTFAGSITLQNRSLWIENTSDTNPNTRLFNLSGQITGTGDLYIDVASTVARVRLINANNSFAGDIRIIRGMLQVGTGQASSVVNAIPDSSTIIFSAGTWLGMGSSDRVGALMGGAADDANSLSAATVRPSIGGTGTTTLTIGGGNDIVDFAGNITDDGIGRVMAITANGLGTQLLTGVNSTYTGTTKITSGTLGVASVADGSGSIGTGPLVLSGGTLLYLGTGTSTTVRELTITPAGGTLNVQQPTGVLSFTGNIGTITGALVKTGPGTATISQPVTGDASVSVQGGTLILEAACTYTGATEILNGASLRLNGSLPGAISIGNGGTLGGSGTIAGLVAIAHGGFISPGNSPGRLTLGGGLSLTGTYLAEIASLLSADSLNIIGDFAANGTVKLRLLDGFSPAENDLFDLADWTGTFSGTPSFDLSEAVLAPGLSWDTSGFATDGTIRVIPEPSTVLLGSLSVLAMLRRHRNRDRHMA